MSLSFTTHIEKLAEDARLMPWLNKHREVKNFRTCRACKAERWADKACFSCADAPEVFALVSTRAAGGG